MKAVEMVSVLALGAMIARGAGAQTLSTESAPADVKSSAEAYQTFYLTNLTEPNEANDAATDLRNMLPKAHLYYDAAEGAISMRGSAEDIALARKILADLDRTRKVYQLTYTIIEKDEGRSVGTQHIAMVVAAGGKTDVKQGSRVPVVTGSVNAESSAGKSQVQYVDVGLSIEASLEGNAEGLRLRSRVEQSSVAEEKSGVGVQDPVIRQTRLEGVSTLAQGKPVILGSLDVPGSTRHEEIEVVSELVR
jgi:type II secretory pathway component GspD/PulD (secretin)